MGDCIFDKLVAGFTFDECLALHDGDEAVTRALWERFVENVRDDRLYIEVDDYVRAAHDLGIPATRPAWVDACIKAYLAKGFDKEEAAQRCYGAYHKQGGRSFRAVTVQEPEGVIEGTLAVWGDPRNRDDYGTWFDRNRPPEMGLKFAPFPLIYEHSTDGEFRKTIIGEVYHIWPDDDGICYRARLDKGKLSDGEFQRLITEIRDGKLGTSSGSAEHLVEFDEQGRFVSWLLSEVSLTKSPAEPRMPHVVLVRRNDKSKPLAGRGAGKRAGAAGKFTRKRKTGVGTMETRNLDAAMAVLVEEYGLDAIKEWLQALEEQQAEMAEEIAMPEGEMPEGMEALSGIRLDDMRAALERISERKKAEALQGEVTALRSEIEQLKIQRQAEPAPTGPVRRAAPRISGGEPWRFAGKSGADLATAYMVRRAMMPETAAMGTPVMSDEFMTVLADRAFDESEQNRVAATEAVRYLRRAVGSPRATRADVMGSDVAGYGDEWVGVFYETELWEAIRTDSILPKLQEKGLNEKAVPRGYESNVIPLEGADPTWYKVAQAANVSANGLPESNIPASKVGTSNTTATVSEVAALCWFTTTLEEDSLIEIAPQLRRQFETSGREQVDYLLINGDTETAASTNINLIDGTPAANVSYLALNGFLKNALVTTTANSRDCGATLDENDYRVLLTYLGTNGKAANDRRKLVYIIDFPTHDASMNIPAIKTRDVFANATIEAGELMKMWNVDVVTTDQMALAYTAGKISATAANNTRGRICLVRPDQWWLARKREMTVETQRWAPAQATAIVATMRLGMVYRDSDSASAVTYNVPV